MPRATITIDDIDGAIDVKCSLEGQAGPNVFDKDSHAHQHAVLLLKHMDTLAQPLDPVAPVDLVPEPPRSMIITPVQRAIQVVRG